MVQKSTVPSQLPSGRATPRKEDDMLDSTYSSPLFSTKLQERLRQLDLGQSRSSSPESSSQSASKLYKNGLVHSIEILGEDRRKTSELAREQALGNLLRHLAMKYDPVIVHYELFTTIIQAFVNGRSESEACTALQLICVSITMVDDSDDPRAEECFDSMNQLRNSLLQRLSAAHTPLVKEAIITSFAVLTYFQNAGGGGYGIEVPVVKLLEIAESVTNASESGMAAAALSGAALLTTLLQPGSASEVAQDWLYSLVPMLDFSNINTRLAVVKFIAVLYEQSDYTKLFGGDNGKASEEIIESLESMCQDSIARTAKKEKKAQNLLVKSVLKTCRLKQELAQRTLTGANLSGKEDVGELSEISDLVLQYHKHVLSKSLGISTWAGLSVVEHLLWVFGPGLHTQLAGNPYVKSLLKREEVPIDIVVDDIDTEESATFHDKPARHQVDDTKRSKELRRLHLQKVKERDELLD